MTPRPSLNTFQLVVEHLVVRVVAGLWPAVVCGALDVPLGLSQMRLAQMATLTPSGA